MLNPDLDRAALAAEFARDGRVRIEGLLDPDVAERIREYCMTEVPFEYLSFVDGRNVAMPAEELNKFSEAELVDLQSKIFNAASNGTGFFYCGYMLERSQRDSDSEALSFLHSVFDFLNSDEMLGFIAEVTGHDDLKSADAQYTRYTQGQFLTRHQDDVGEEQRRLAYVISFSKNWHPDWGGLLQFFEKDGTPRESWIPAFNTMSLFNIGHVHSVTYVTPFAPEPRLSLTGWFRAKEW